MSLEPQPTSELSPGEKVVQRTERLLNLVFSVTRYPQTIEIYARREAMGIYNLQEKLDECIQNGWGDEAATISGVIFVREMAARMEHVISVFDEPTLHPLPDDEQELYDAVSLFTSRAALLNAGIDPDNLTDRKVSSGREAALEPIYDGMSKDLLDDGHAKGELWPGYSFAVSATRDFPSNNDATKRASWEDLKWNHLIHDGMTFLRKVREMEIVNIERLADDRYSERFSQELVEYSILTGDLNGVMKQVLLQLGDKAQGLLKQVKAAYDSERKGGYNQTKRQQAEDNVVSAWIAEVL
jgi:hypothetical protein